MNPRVSRSSALASKATGFPIAKIAALLAIGYSLDEIKNDITKVTPSCYEPALDYVVTKIPKFVFEKFAGSKDSLTTQMKSVGEVMAIGRTFKESFVKAINSLESNKEGIFETKLSVDKLSYPNSQRIFHIFQALREGMSVEEINHLTQITPWFLDQLFEIVELENTLKHQVLDSECLLKAKRFGFLDSHIAGLKNLKSADVLALRNQFKIKPAFFQVDTCAAEFDSSTPYFYSTYWGQPTDNNFGCQPIVVIGSGPNRIGQGIEFDYSCVRGVKALQAAGKKVVMVNSNPETVSTDYDTSDFLFFEPLTAEHVSEIMEWVKPFGFVAQLGGQTPINLATSLNQQGFKLLGSSVKSIDMAEDRGVFAQICNDLKLNIPRSLMVSEVSEALKFAQKNGYPLICRPSYVLGGRRMEVIENQKELENYFERHSEFISSQMPCLVDQFLEGALEVDVDLVRGLDWTLIGGVVEHIEAAGVHSGDSMGVLPPQRLLPHVCTEIEKLSAEIAQRLNIIGHLNLQLAIKNNVVYVLEANPRSSRSVPFICKAANIPLIDCGIWALLGKTKSELNLDQYNWHNVKNVNVKGVVFPFKKFADSDSILGPEMKSTGETMGRGLTYSEALMKALLSSYVKLPQKGEIFLSLRDKDKAEIFELSKILKKMGYTFSATAGTAKFFNDHGVSVTSLKKVHEGRPHCVDRIRSGEIAIVFNTTRGRQSVEASFDIRKACIDHGVPCITESDAAEAFVLALKQKQENHYNVSPLGNY
jgi:carbamoyl-phosphate synthase large subunit